MKAALNILGGLGVIALVMGWLPFRRRTALAQLPVEHGPPAPDEEEEQPAEPEPEPGPVTPPKLIAATVPGFRRARRSEIPPEILADAPATLSEVPMGHHVVAVANDGRVFAYAAEEHFDERRGAHKGISVFIHKDD